MLPPGRSDGYNPVTSARAMELFDVYVARFTVPEERAVRGLMRVFGLSEASARIFYRSLPRMGKRQVPLMAAERYMRALSSVGAVSECRASKPITIDGTRSSRPPPAGTSLPPPNTTTPPSLQSGPAGPSSSGFVPFGDQMPVIPKAARLPRELSGATSAAYDGEHDGSGFAGSNLVLADVGPNSDLARGTRGSYIPTRDSSSRAIRPDYVGIASSFAPKPGSSQPVPRTTFWYKYGTALVFLIAMLLGALGVGYIRGWFETDDGRREAEWANIGIATGDYENVRTFLSGRGRRFERMPDSEAQLIIDGLFRAGARDIWAIRIREIDGARTSGGVIVALPSDMSARRTIFFQHAPLTPTRDIAEDRGQPYLVLDL
jgi:hypothetical protein